MESSRRPPARGLRPAALVFVGNAVARGLGFLYPVLLARVVDKPEFALVIFFINTGFFVGELVLTGYPTALTRALAAETGASRRGSWLSSALVGGGPLLVLSVATGVVLAWRADADPLLLAVVVVGLSIDAYYFGLLRGLQRYVLLVGYRISANLAQLVLLALAAIVGLASEQVAVVIYAFVYLVPILIFELIWRPIRTGFSGHARPTRAMVRDLTLFAVPALVSGTAYGAIVGFDVFFVRTLAPSALADYGAARTLALPMSLVPFAISVVLLPRVAAAGAVAQRHLLRTALLVVTGASVAGWLGYVVAGPFFIRLVFPPSYVAAEGLLPVLVPAIALVGIYSVLSQWWLGIGRPTVPAVSLTIGAVVTIAGHLTLTAHLGAPGAALSIIIGILTAILLLGAATLRMDVGQRPTQGGPRRVLLVGYYGMDNLGDEAIRAAIESAAPSFGVVIDRVAVRGPVRYPDHEVRLSLTGWPRYFEAIRRADVVVLGGGGILKDEGLRLPVDLVVTTIVALLLRTPTRLLAVGVGPFYSGFGRRMIGFVARRASVRTVRDTESAEALAALGVDSVVVGADPVFSQGDDATPEPADASASISRESPGSPPPAVALVSIRPWFIKDRDGADARAAFRGVVSAGLEPLIAAGWTLRLSALYWPRDAEEAGALAAAIGPTAPVTLLERPVQWKDLLADVAASGLVVAMRYHALAAAIVAGRPCIALVYEPKVAALAAEVAIPGISVDAPDLAEQLVAATTAFVEGGAAMLPSLATRAALRARARDVLELVLGV